MKKTERKRWHIMCSITCPMTARLKPLLLTLFGLLFFQSSSAQILSPYVDQAVAIAPRNPTPTFVSEDHPMAEVIDQAVLDILATETGKVFCGALSADERIFHRALFIRADRAREGFRLCRGRYSARMAFSFFPKRYFLITTPETEFKADGWTTPRNETFIFLSDHEPRLKSRMIRTIAHEMAVAFDLKEQFGFAGNLHLDLLMNSSESQVCELIPIVREAAFKQTLSAVRAFDIEQRIIRELKLEMPQAFLDWERLSCIERLETVERHVRPLQKAFQAESLVNLLMDQTRCSSRTPQSFAEQLEKFSKLSVTLPKGDTVPACEFFGRGWPYLPGVSFRGGPGPRVGGGGW